MPVDERAIWIWFPCPDVQRVEWRKSEAIWAFEIVVKLAHELRRALAGMGFVPWIGQDQKVGANQLKMAIRLRFINHNLGLRCINHAAPHQSHIHVVKSHGT